MTETEARHTGKEQKIKVEGRGEFCRGKTRLNDKQKCGALRRAGREPCQLGSFRSFRNSVVMVENWKKKMWSVVKRQ